MTSPAVMIDGAHSVDFRYAPAHRSTLICRPGDHHRTLVNENGELVYGDEPPDRSDRPATGRFPCVVRFGIASNEPPIEVEQFTDDPCVPIVTTIVRYRTFTLNLRACGHRDDVGRRVDVVRWRVSAEHDEPGVAAAVHIEIVGDDQFAVVADTVLHPQQRVELGRGSAMRTADSLVSARRAATGSIAVLLDGPPFEGPHLEPGWADEAFAAERRFWAGVPQRSIELRVPDRGLMDLMDASARTIIQAGQAHPSTPDAAVLAEALWFLGFADRARAELETALHRTDRAGARTPATLAETAACITMIVRQHELDGTSQLTPPETTTLRTALVRGGELRNATGERGGRDEQAARLWALAALSMVTRCDVAPRDLRVMAAEIKAVLDATLARRGWREWAIEDVSTSLPLRALTHAIYPAEAFAADDALVTGLCDLLDHEDDEEGIPLDNAHLALAAAPLYADAWLYAGHPQAAIDYLYAFANHATPAGVSHDATTAAAFIRLIRNLLVFERGDEVEFLAGVPSAWLHPGTEIVVEQTPTRFGPVSMRVSIDADNSVHLAVEADWLRSPRRIVFRPPLATTAVRVDGRQVDKWDGGIVAEPASAITATFVRAGATIRVPVTGHAATKGALRNWTVFSSAHAFKPDIRAYRQFPIESDGRAHDEYRMISASWFRRARVAEHEPQIRVVATDLIAGLAAAGRVEAVHEIALPLVVRSLALMVGRPQDADEWLSWGVAMNVVHGHRDGRETDSYLARVFDEVGLHPGEDIFSDIVASAHFDRPLTRRERFGLGSMVLTAGRAATVNLLAGTVWLLASRPADRARLAADPTLVPIAIEEALRYLSPVPEMDRAVVSDIDGASAGSHVALSFVSANRDASVFAAPHDFDLTRHPNPHVAFGNGPHTCVGTHLARLEARVLVEELLRVVPDFECDGEPEMTWQRVGATDTPRDFASMPITVAQ